jgi:hypothetical protein
MYLLWRCPRALNTMLTQEAGPRCRGALRESMTGCVDDNRSWSSFKQCPDELIAESRDEQPNPPLRLGSGFLDKRQRPSNLLHGVLPGDALLASSRRSRSSEDLPTMRRKGSTRWTP